MGCSVDGCSGKVKARGWCQKHYKRWLNHGSVDSGRHAVRSIDCRRSVPHSESSTALLLSLRMRNGSDCRKLAAKGRYHPVVRLSACRDDGGHRAREPNAWDEADTRVVFVDQHENALHQPKSLHFKHYGGRGITVCARWDSFENFYADMGPRPAGLTLDRIDVDGNYEPANCKWSTTLEQRRNQRRSR